MLQCFNSDFCRVNALFLVAGVAQSLLAFELNQVGFTRDSWTFMGNPIGQFLLAAVDRRLWHHWRRSLLLSATPIIVCEVVCNIFSQIAIPKIGRDMYQAVCCFLVVLNLIFAHGDMQIELSFVHWGAVVLIGCSNSVAVSHLQHEDTDFSVEVDGIMASVVATVFASAVYVLANRLLEDPWDSPVPKPLVLMQMVGTVEVVIVTAYVLAYVVPDWGAYGAESARPDASVPYCIMLNALYVSACGAHQYAFYNFCSLGPAAAVTAGINKSVQTSLLFFLFHIFYCDADMALQCLSWLKVMGAMVVGISVVMYGYTGVETSRQTGDSPGHIGVSMFRAVTV